MNIMQYRLIRLFSCEQCIIIRPGITVARCEVPHCCAWCFCMLYDVLQMRLDFLSGEESPRTLILHRVVHFPKAVLAEYDEMAVDAQGGGGGGTVAECVVARFMRHANAVEHPAPGIHAECTVFDCVGWDLTV